MAKSACGRAHPARRRPRLDAAQLNPAVAFSAAETALAWRDNRLSTSGDTQARRLAFAPGVTDRQALSYDGLHRLTAISGPASESFSLDGPGTSGPWSLPSDQ